MIDTDIMKNMYVMRDGQKMRLVKKTIHELGIGEVLMVNNWEYDDENDELMLYYDDLLVDTLGIWEMFNPYVMKFYELVKP